MKLRTPFAGKPAGAKAQVLQSSRGGSGLTIRFDDDGKTVASITEKHIELL